MAFHRKVDAVLDLNPDIAVISECAKPEILLERGANAWMEGDPVWIGKNPNKGLGVFAFNDYSASLAEPWHPYLAHIAPVQIQGPTEFNILAVWAQNMSGGTYRKGQSGPLRRALSAYRDFLTNRPTIVAGDFNNNIFWDKPGWRMNHQTVVDKLSELGLVSAYHESMREAQGAETVPTHYWRDRKKDGPTYHIDYAFVPTTWMWMLKQFELGTFEDWCGNGFSDHVPLILDIDV